MDRFTQNRFLIGGLVIAALVWPIDAAIESYRHPELDFSALLLHPSLSDGLSRVLLALLTLALSIYIHSIMRRLQHNQERFDLILHAVNGGVWEWSPETDMLECSSQLLHGTLGYGEETQPSMRLEQWMALIHPDDREDVLHALHGMAGGHLHRYEHEARIRHQNGHWVHIRFRAFAARKDNHGTPARIVGTIADITEHKRMEQEHLHRAEQHEVMLSTTTDGYWLVGDDGTILETNEAYCRMTGLARDEVEGHPISDFEMIESPEETAEHIGRVTISGFDRFETKHRCKDGRIIDVEVSASFLREKKQFIGFLRDITASKRAKEELLRLSRVVDQTSEGVLIVNRAGIIEYVNPAFCKNTGFAREEAVGQRPSILKSGAQDDAFYNHMWDAISQGKSWNGSVVDRRKDGSFFPALLSIFPVHDESGKTLYFVGIQRDISDLKRLEDQFLQAQKMEAIGTLVGGIAHDFNNMLAAIQASCYLAKLKTGSDPKEVTDKLADIEKLTERAAEMIRHLMAFARKDNATPRRPLSLTSFLKEGLKLARTAIPENIDFTSDICEDDLVIDGDATQLQQVIMNLLNNAHDAVADVKDPRISCSLEPFTATDAFLQSHPDCKSKRLACLSIRDNGIGIADDHLGKIFEPFYTTKGVGKGTGLGLAMVYGVIEAHGGYMEVESAPGEGAAFHVYLPLQQAPDMTPETRADTAPAKGHGETILLVDDESSIRTAAAAMLDSLGYKVMAATDGEDAIALLKQEHDVALIITDMVMPRMGGLALAEALRQSGDDTPIIFATAYDREQMPVADRSIAHSAIIRKPFSPEGISQMMRRLIDAKPSMRQ